MTKVMFAIMLAIPGLAFAGDLGRAAVSLDLKAFSLSDVRPADIPVPRFVTDEPRGEVPPKEWLDAVKNIYLSYQGMIPVMPEELPAAALRQMQEDAVVYPSKAFKVTIQGRTAFVIENDNNDALYVNIFDEQGNHIAFGGVDENADFWWL